MGHYQLMNDRSWPRLRQKRLDFGVAGTAHHIGNESSAFKTSSPTSVTCQSKFRSYLPPALVILRFDPASAESGPSNLYISPDMNDRYWKKRTFRK